MRSRHGFRRALLSTVVASLLLLTLPGCGPGDPLETIRRQQAAGAFEATLEPLRQLLKEHKDEAEVLYLYGRALGMTRQASLGEWSLREAMKDPEWLVPAGSQLAFNALGTRNFLLAIETTTRLLEVEPDSIDILMMRAQAYAHSRIDREAALADVERIFELDPDNLEAFEPQILALLGLERIDEAGEALEILGERIEEAQLEPKVGAWYCATTAIFAADGDDLETARERWAECEERYPGDSQVVSPAIEFHDSQGEYDRSLEILRRAHETEPSRDYRVELAQRLYAVGQPAEAEALLLAATENPSLRLAGWGWLDLVKHYQGIDNYAAAAQAAERMVEMLQPLGPVDPRVMFEFADSLLLADQFDRALAVAAELTVPAQASMIRARVAQKRGQYAQALRHFDEGFRLWPNNPWAHYYAALAAEALGDFDRAIASYRHSIRIKPGATDARVRLARLHMAEGYNVEALQMLRLMLDEAPLDLEGELLSLELWARVGSDEKVHQSLRGFQSGLPDQLGRAAASAAEGLRYLAGDAAAVELLRDAEAQGFDLADPRNAEALRLLVRISRAVDGQSQAARASARAAVAAHPDSAVLQEILGRSLHFGGGAPAEARAAYTRAVELDPAEAQALAGLGRLALAEDPEAALGFFERAIVADPTELDGLRGAARTLVALGRSLEAEARLAELLAADPYDAAAASRLVELQLARGGATDETVALASRAVRFGGGSAARDLLARAHLEREKTGRPDAAAAGDSELRARSGS